MLTSLRKLLARRRLAAEAARWKAANMERGAWLAPDVQVLGWKNVRIGRATIVSAGTWLNVNDRAADQASILIGANCFLGRRNFLSAGQMIEVGDYCLTGVDCHFLGADHIHTSPFEPYMTTGTTSGGTIKIGANCWLGSSVTVLKDVEIGFGSIIGAAAVVTRSIAPFSIAVGNPARVIKRYDMRRAAWVPATELETDQDYPAEADYVAALKSRHPSVKGPRIASSPIFGDL
jgi:acetyltransferase-like isoleucine patch superfamily enzyme